MTADEVLEEFLLDPCCIDCPASDCINERRMAEEIVRLREEIDRLRKGKEIVTSMLFDQVPLLNRMQDTLDRLQKPSDDVIDAASHAFTTAMTGDGDWYAGDQWGSIAKAIEAAVAAAEQEVANDAS